MAGITRDWFARHNMEPTRYVFTYEDFDGEWIVEPCEDDDWDDMCDEAARIAVTWGTGNFEVHDLAFSPIKTECYRARKEDGCLIVEDITKRRR